MPGLLLLEVLQRGACRLRQLSGERAYLSLVMMLAMGKRELSQADQRCLSPAIREGEERAERNKKIVRVAGDYSWRAA